MGGVHKVEVVGFDADGWVIQNSFGPHLGNRGFERVTYGKCRLSRPWHLALTENQIVRRSLSPPMLMPVMDVLIG